MNNDYSDNIPPENYDEMNQETFKWYFRSDDNPTHIKTQNLIWTEHSESEMIENAYQDYLYMMTNDPDNIKDYEIFIVNEIKIDLVNNIQFSSEDNNDERLIGRFKGDPNVNQNLKNLVKNSKYRWYFIYEDEFSDEIVWVPYRKHLNTEIEKNFQKYLLSKGSEKFSFQDITVDYVNLQEKNHTSGLTKTIARFINFDENNNIPYKKDKNEKKTTISVLNRENIQNVKRDYLLNLKNIFPSRYYSRNQNYEFYYNSENDSIILHLESGWSNNDFEPNDTVSTTELLTKIIEDGYSVICKINREGDKLIFQKLFEVPFHKIRSLFKTNWYSRLNQNNSYLWRQYSKDTNLLIENSYKNDYLLVGNHTDIEISEEIALTINFQANKQILGDSSLSIMRFNIKNPFPDKITNISVPNVVYDKFNNENFNKNPDFEEVYYANKFGPKNIVELVKEISEEVRREGNNLDLQDEVKKYDENYLQHIHNNNFVSSIIKIYTEEGFVYRRINKIMRDQDYSLFWSIKYYYISLLYCLKHISNEFSHPFLYRGLKIRGELLNFYQNLSKGNLILFNEFLSTTYDRSIAEKYADKGSGSFILEIEIPKEYGLSSIEKFSRFQHEKEVLIPSGSILEFKELEIKEDISLINMTLIPSNRFAFSKLISSFEKSIDLTTMDLEFSEIDYLFECLNNNHKINSINLRITHNHLIPIVAKKVATNKTLTYISISMLDGLFSEQTIFHYKPYYCTVFLKDFNHYDFRTFIQVFSKFTTFYNYLSFDNYYISCLKELEHYFTKSQNLKTFKLNLNVQSINEEFIHIQQLSFINNLIELNLNGFFLVSNSVSQIGSFIRKNKSLERIAFSLNKHEELNTISKSIKRNNNLKYIHISFHNNSIKNNRRFKYQKINQASREIVFTNILNTGQHCFFSNLFMNESNIVDLDISNNEIDKAYLFQLSDLFINNKQLKSVNLSNNILTDKEIKVLSEIWMENDDSININLDNNNLTNNCYLYLKEFKNMNFSINYNFIENLQYQKTKNSNSKYECTLILEGHTSSIYFLCLLSDGNLASCSVDSSIRIWKQDFDFQCIAILNGHEKDVNTIIEIEDKKIISGSSDTTIKIWDPSNKYVCIKTLLGHTNSVLSFVLLPQGLLASGSEDDIRIWDTRNQFEFKNRLIGHSNHVSSIIYLPNGNLASSSYDYTIMIWDGNNNYKCFHVIEYHKNVVYYLINIHDGIFASASFDQTIGIWDSNDNYNCIKILKGHCNRIYSLALIDNGKFISSGCDNTVCVWDSNDDYNMSYQFTFKDLFVYSSLHLGKNKLCFACRDGKIRIFEKENRSLIKINNIEQQDEVLCLAIFSDGNLASGCNDKTINIWDSKQNFKNILTLTDHYGKVTSLLVLSDEKLASGSNDNTIKIWDPTKEYSCILTLTEHTKAINTLILIDGGKFASGSFDNTIKIWDPNFSYQCIYTIGGHLSFITEIINFSERKLISASFDMTIRIWDANYNYDCVQIIRDHKDAVVSLIEIGDGKIVSSSNDRSVKIWKFYTTFICLQTINTDFIIKRLCFSKFGDIIMGDLMGNIFIWNPQNEMKSLLKIRGHKTMIGSIFSLSDGTLVSCSDDKTIKIWIISREF